MASIQGIYIALFGRPADPLGLDFFNEATNNGADLAAISDLAATAEYQDRFEGQNNTQIVNSIYQSLFGRDADLAGLTFFVNALSNGTLNINNIAIAILDGAQNDDLLTVNNKITAAEAFTAALDTGSEVVAYSGNEAAEAGRAFLAGIKADEATIPTEAQTDAAIAAIVDDSNAGGDGETFTLTSSTNVVTGGVDEVTGTAGADTIRAVIANSLDSGDIIDGGAGSDVLNISAGAIKAGAAPVITNVETINNAGADLDLTSVTGVERINSSATAVYKGASLSTTFAAAGAADVTVNVAGSVSGKSDTLKLAVDDNDGTAVAFNTVAADLATDNSTTIENITLASEGDTGSKAVADIVDLATFTKLQTVSVSGAGDIEVQLASTELKSIDASGLTGAFEIDASASGKDITAVGGSAVNKITTGAGDDTITGGAKADTIVAGAGDDTINGGAGNDNIDGGAGDDVITGGAGADTLKGDTGEDTFVYTAQTDSTYVNFDTISDFTLADDVIDLSALNLAGSTDSVVAGTTTNTTIGQFAGGVTGFFDGDAVATFTEGAVTYVMADVDGNGNFDASSDLVIKLTGALAITEDHFVF